MIVYISIGNSDDRLTQQQWSEFWIDMAAEVVSVGHTHGAWFSNPVGAFQNACWCVEFTSAEEAEGAKAIAGEIGRKYQQDAVAWAVVDHTEFAP
jgi:hypothetical protein